MEEIFVAPTWSKGPQVIVPPSMVHWLAHQPSVRLNARDCALENLQSEYTLPHHEIFLTNMIEQLIKKDLTRTIGSLNAEVLEEIEFTFLEQFGSDTEQWKEVCVWDSISKAVARTENRVFVGPELCESPTGTFGFRRCLTPTRSERRIPHDLHQLREGYPYWCNDS